ncbi:uncharacterized protein LOC135930370 isoform X2 [Gordionus sp. m RMFG-2023]|uniref:uncharacterized protein LOC135930370 isoform X2 n=1 Tax=Gordionus sp. m RMFG-2023 TaxID=3053472 RepID=UPI0031FC974E
MDNYDSGSEMGTSLRKRLMGIFVTLGICVSWPSATQIFYQLQKQSSKPFNAPAFVAIIYSTTLLMSISVIFLACNLYTRRCFGLLVKPIASTLATYRTNGDSNPLGTIPRRQRSFNEKKDGNNTSRDRMFGNSDILKFYLKTLFGLSLDPRRKSQGKRKALWRLCFFSFLWSSSLYFYLLASFLMSPSEITTIYSSQISFVYAFSWVILHEKFLAHKIIAKMCFITSIILITHYRGDFLSYLGHVLLIVLSSILYSLFKVNFKNIFGYSPLISSQNNPLSSHSLANPNEMGNDINIGSDHNINNDKTYSANITVDEAARSYLQISKRDTHLNHLSQTTLLSPLANNKSKIRRSQTSPSAFNYLGHKDISTRLSPFTLLLNKMAFFYFVLCIANLLLFWPVAILFHFTKVERVSWKRVKWLHLLASAVLHTAHILLLEFGPLIACSNYTTLGICFSVIINADMYFNNLNFNRMLQISYAFILFGFILLLLPEEWHNFTGKIVRVKKINGNTNNSVTSTIPSMPHNEHAAFSVNPTLLGALEKSKRPTTLLNPNTNLKNTTTLLPPSTTNNILSQKIS